MISGRLCSIPRDPSSARRPTFARAALAQDDSDFEIKLSRLPNVLGDGISCGIRFFPRLVPPYDTSR